MSVDRIHVCLQVDGHRFALKAAVVVRLPEGDESMIPYVGDCHPRTKRRYKTVAEAMESAGQLVQDILAQPPLRTGSEVAG